MRSIVGLKKCCAVSILLGLQAACAQTPTPEHSVQAYVLMPLNEFIERNSDAIQEQLPSLDPGAGLLSVVSSRPTAFEYRDPKGRFELSYSAVGSPANSTRFMISRGTRLGLQELAIKHMEFALSDGAPLAQRIDEAIKLDVYLQKQGFRPVGYATFQEKASEITLTNFHELAQHVDQLEVPRIGGMHLFTNQRDELIFDVSLIEQLYTSGDDDYTLYIIIREKVLDVE